VQGAELGGPVALELAVLVAADLAADLAVELEVLALLARHEGVGAQLVDHRRPPVSGTAGGGGPARGGLGRGGRPPPAARAARARCWGSRMRRRSGWPSRRPPTMSKPSRSIQSAPG